MNAIIYYLWYLNILLKRFLSICDQSYWNRGLKRSIDSHNEAHFHSQANNDSWRLNRSRFLLAKKPEIFKIFYCCDCEFLIDFDQNWKFGKIFVKFGKCYKNFCISFFQHDIIMSRL